MGHLAIAYLGWVAIERRGVIDHHHDSAVLVLALGALFPDLIDKPLAWYVGVLPTGRSLGHSLIVLIPLCVALGFVAKRHDRLPWAIAFTIGAISHVLVDAAPVLWRDDASARFLMYPVLPVQPYPDADPPGFWMLLQNSLTEPYFALEFVLLGIAIIVWSREGYPGITTVRGIVSVVRR